MFHRNNKQAHKDKHINPAELDAIKSANSILSDGKRTHVLNKIASHVAMDEQRYLSLCQSLIEHISTQYQLLPEAHVNFYAQAGGLIDHALNRTEIALELLNGFIIPAETGLSEEQQLWQYALYSASMLKGMGKLATDYVIELFDSKAQRLKTFNPLYERMGETGQFYDYHFGDNAAQDYRNRLTVLMAQKAMPYHGFLWISSDHKVLENWLALLMDDLRGAGTLGAILNNADALAIARYFDEWLLLMASKKSQRRFASSLGGASEYMDKELEAGLLFIQWLKNELAEGRIMINQAPLHMVPGGMLMSKEMYQLFMREHPEYKNWLAVQKGVAALGLHQPQSEGARFAHNQTHQIQEGLVLESFAAVLPNMVRVNRGGSVQEMSSIAFVHAASQYGSQFHRIPEETLQSSLQVLNTKGEWQVPDATHPTVQSGVSIRG